MKYIVKNCPTFLKKNLFYTCGNLDVGEICCEDCTDCLIKQVIGKCRKYGVTYLGNEILQLFKIKECEHRCDTHKTLLADGHIMEFENYCQITNDGCYAIDCYYKQLKRKEQECESLNADNISLRDRVGKLERAILRRNEQLDQLKTENDLFRSCHDNEQAKRRKFEQAIEDIHDLLKEYEKSYGSNTHVERAMRICEVLD